MTNSRLAAPCLRHKVQPRTSVITLKLRSTGLLAEEKAALIAALQQGTMAVELIPSSPIDVEVEQACLLLARVPSMHQ